MKKELAKEIVKKNLWKRGYSVKDVSEFSIYDLVVNKKYKVFVAQKREDLLKLNAFDIVARCNSGDKKYGKQISYGFAGTIWKTNPMEKAMTSNPKEVFK